MLVPCENRFNELNMKFINETRTSKNRSISFFFLFLQLREKRMEAQDCKMKNLIAVLFDFKLDPFRGGHKGGTNTAIPHVVAREYHNTAS